MHCMCGWVQTQKCVMLVCVSREVQKALSRARGLYERWEELLQEGTQVSARTGVCVCVLERLQRKGVRHEYM